MACYHGINLSILEADFLVRSVEAHGFVEKCVERHIVLRAVDF